MSEVEFLVLPIIFLAAFTRSTFGFGDALIAMPLLSFFVPIEFATPFVGLAAVAITISILAGEWRNIEFKSVFLLIIAAVIGIPVGIFYVKGLYDELLKVILGVIIILFSLFNLTKPELFYLKNDKLAFVFGFVGGVLGGAFNTSGPAVVIYSVLRKWNPKTIRATLQGVFLPTGIFIAIGHGIAGLWTKHVVINFLVSLPLIINAVIIGGFLNKKFKKDRFTKYIYILLILIGTLLVLKNI